MISLFRRRPEAAAPTPLERLAEDRRRRWAEAGSYREHRDAQLCPSRKQHIQDLLEGKVRPRKTNKGYPI